jgi:hypothetical protein
MGYFIFYKVFSVSVSVLPTAFNILWCKLFANVDLDLFFNNAWRIFTHSAFQINSQNYSNRYLWLQIRIDSWIRLWLRQSAPSPTRCPISNDDTQISCMDIPFVNAVPTLSHPCIQWFPALKVPKEKSNPRFILKLSTVSRQHFD